MHIVRSFEIKEIIPLITHDLDYQVINTKSGAFSVRVGSPRMAMLRDNQSCANCKRKPNAWLLHANQSALKYVCHIKENCPVCPANIQQTSISKENKIAQLGLFYCSKYTTIEFQVHKVVPKDDGDLDEKIKWQVICRCCAKRLEKKHYAKKVITEVEGSEAFVHSGMRVFGTWRFDELIDRIGPTIEGSKRKVSLSTEYGKFNVKVTSKRLRTFKLNNKCVSCSVIGSIWKLESSASNYEMPHLNLYAVIDKPIPGYEKRTSNGYVLMTQDHIIPVSKGGEDTMENLQTMCEICNSIKGNKLP